jgi:hypothetical protein
MTIHRPIPKENRKMKKLVTLMLGLSLAFGTVAVTFAQGDTAKKDTTKKSPKKGGKKDTTKTDKTGN